THHALRLSYGRSISPRTSLTLSQQAAYRPYFSVVPFAAPSTLDPTLQDEETDPGLGMPGTDPGGGGPEDITLGARRRGIMYTGSATLRRVLTPRSSLQFLASYNVAD